MNKYFLVFLIGIFGVTAYSQIPISLNETDAKGKRQGQWVLLYDVEWEKVVDTATQLLMSSFYENWLGGMSKREAFKAAQESLRKNPQYRHPYYWGGFVMIGG